MSIYSFRKLIRAGIVVIVMTIIAGLCFAMFKIDQYARDESFLRIEESTGRVASRVRTFCDKSSKALNLLGTFISNTDKLSDMQLHTHMEYFCIMNNFDGTTLLRNDGTLLSSGVAPAIDADRLHFQEEVAKLPYTAAVLDSGTRRAKQYVRVAVPVKKNGQTVAILYGYISLDTLATYATSKDYNGHCSYFLIDGNNGMLLVDESHRYNKSHIEVPLDNLFTGKLNLRQTADGMSLSEMKQRMADGKSGHNILVFQNSSHNYYTYYTPLGINNWFTMIAVDEKEAFENFHAVRKSSLILIGLMIVFSMLIIYFLYRQKQKELTQEQELASAAAKASLTDYLTGVGNRRSAYEYMQKLQHGQELGIVFCDVTGLKQTNDEKGHQQGDLLLQNAVQGILAAFDRKQVFRVGGDEFIVMCTNTTQSDMLQRIDTMNDAWKASGINVACGSAWIDAYSGDSDALVTLAEQRMYESKKKWYRISGRERRKSK